MNSATYGCEVAELADGAWRPLPTVTIAVNQGSLKTSTRVGLRGDELRKYTERCISIISWIEIMVGARTQEEEKKCRAFLASFRVISVDEAIADKAYRLRRKHGNKIPDALI
jgi:predicted nucleic acid-binding protein